MCDYSLEFVASRPAKVGETLVTTRFHGFTGGFAAVEERNVAVCLLPGTELAFEKEVECATGRVRHSLRQVGHKVARFRQINKDRRDVHHDALEFPDGEIVLLTHLREGQHATVLQLPAERPAMKDEVQKHESIIV
jgi:hypothetical protein